MRLFMLDLWEDLREKRLAPVAAVMLVAILALPVVVLERSSPDPGDSAAPPQAAVSQADRAIVQLAADALASGGSSLDVFTPRDPFRPRGKAARALLDAADEAAGAGAAPALAEDGPAGGPGTGAAPAGDDKSTGGSGGGTTPKDEDTGSTKPDKPSKPVSYTYTVDLRFGRSGSERLYRGVQRLDVIPRTGSPILVYLGVSPTAKSAIFLVDSSVEQHGDGRCKPTPEECTFLYMTLEKSHDLHFFTNADGAQYALRLTDIQRERTDVVARRAKAANKAAAAKRRASRSDGGADEPRRTPRFYPGFGADEESVGDK